MDSLCWMSESFLGLWSATYILGIMATCLAWFLWRSRFTSLRGKPRQHMICNVSAVCVRIIKGESILSNDPLPAITATRFHEHRGQAQTYMENANNAEAA